MLRTRYVIGTLNQFIKSNFLGLDKYKNYWYYDIRTCNFITIIARAFEFFCVGLHQD